MHVLTSAMSRRPLQMSLSSRPDSALLETVENAVVLPERRRDLPRRGPDRRRVSRVPRGPLLEPVAPRAPLATRDGRAVTIVHLSAELAPWARTGGLGEAVFSLARHQALAGSPTVVFVPLHRAVYESGADLRPVGRSFHVQLGSRRVPGRVYQLMDDRFRGAFAPRIYFIGNEEFFDRSGLYGEGGKDYVDNAQRFAFFVLAALESLPRIVGGPAVVHAHDWHAALAPIYARTSLQANPYLRDVSTVLSVHNAGYQGVFPATTLAELGLPRSLFNWRQLEWYGQINLLKGGLQFADRAVTVSPTHAQELRSSATGFGLDGVFQSMGPSFSGIVNGIDQDEWDPATDRTIASRYSRDDLTGKRRCRAALQRALGLERRPHVPIFAMSARLVAQKGLDLILHDPGYFALDAQFAFLGSGDARYAELLRNMAARAPSRIAVRLDFSEEMERRLLAGADVLLMPSQYEPCGLTQMRAQRYGTIPIARRVGGLADTVEDGVTGFLFDEYSPAGLMGAITRATEVHGRQPEWQQMVREAMSRNFSWDQSVRQYFSLYRGAIGAARETR